MNDRLQSALAVRLAKAQTRAAGEHPDVDRLAAFRERRMSSVSRENLASHLAGCAECREILSAVAQASGERPVLLSGHRSRLICLGSAAALAVLFAATSSRIDDGTAMRALAELQRASQTATQSARGKFIGPKVAYASADVKPSAAAIEWRIRQTDERRTLEFSPDGGKNWRPATLNGPFEPAAVGFSGMDVWVKSRSGDMLLSRDAGVHWTPLKPVQRR
jgi:hypothetical protein